MIYFAYGSNLLHQRLIHRTPSARVLTTGSLSHHTLRFHKKGDDGSGKCDAFFTGSPEDRIHGVVYHLDEDDKEVLDRIEGVGYGYHRKTIEILMPATRGEQRQESAFTYVVDDTYIDPSYLPFTWYKNFVLAGALQNGFPRAYIERIQSVTSRDDPDRERSEHNHNILQSAPDLASFWPF